MIVLDLACAQGHVFEGWFASAEDFAAQQARGLVSCPSCGSAEVARKLSAPYVNTRSGARDAAPATSPATTTAPASPAPQPSAADLQAMLRAVLKVASRQCTDVGPRFAEEARRMHYGESESRAIRGQASRDELEELLDEGISVLPVPPDDAESH